jgi:hypothetical protein
LLLEGNILIFLKKPSKIDLQTLLLSKDWCPTSRVLRCSTKRLREL